MMKFLAFCLLYLATLMKATNAFTAITSSPHHHSHHHVLTRRPGMRDGGTSTAAPTRTNRIQPLQMANDEQEITTKDKNNDDEAAKFGFGARIESIKCVVVGALGGGIALTPAALIKDCILDPTVANGLAQWEFDTDMGSLQAALFAIVYRYCIREDTNPQLKDGVVGAFVLTRTLARIQIPTYCSAVPLTCGEPFGYVDWDILGQLAINGAESAILFSATAAAMEYCFERGYISKFPG